MLGLMCLIYGMIVVLYSACLRERVRSLQVVIMKFFDFVQVWFLCWYGFMCVLYVCMLLCTAVGVFCIWYELQEKYVCLKWICRKKCERKRSLCTSFLVLLWCFSHCEEEQLTRMKIGYDVSQFPRVQYNVDLFSILFVLHKFYCVQVQFIFQLFQCFNG